MSYPGLRFRLYPVAGPDVAQADLMDRPVIRRREQPRRDTVGQAQVRVRLRLGLSLGRAEFRGVPEAHREELFAVRYLKPGDVPVL